MSPSRTRKRSYKNEPLPWEGLPTGYTRSQTFKLPARELEMLRWLGETTFGENQTTIIRNALRNELTERLVERGFDVARDEEDGLVVTDPGEGDEEKKKGG